MLARGIEAIEPEYAHLVVDSAAGISNQTIAFAAASDVVLIVTTPDVTALTDAYAFLKALLARRSDCDPLFVVNRAASDEEAASVAERMVAVSRKFAANALVRSLPEDRAVARAERACRSSARPGSAFARGLETSPDGSSWRSVGTQPGLDAR